MPLIKPKQKPMIPKARKLKKLGFARTINLDGTIGKIAKVDFNPYEKKHAGASKTMHDLLGKKLPPVKEIVELANQERADARKERQIVEYKKRIDAHLKEAGLEFRISDIARNTYNEIARINRIKPKKSKFLMEFNNNLRKEYLTHFSISKGGGFGGSFTRSKNLLDNVIKNTLRAYNVSHKVSNISYTKIDDAFLSKRIYKKANSNSRG